LAQWIAKTAIAVGNWVKNNEKVQAVIEKIKNAFKSAGESIDAWVNGLKETDNIPKYIFEGLINGLKNGSTKVMETITMVATQLITTVKGVLGIHSPSTVFFEIGENIIQGLINGIKSAATFVYELVKGIGTKISEIFKSIDFGKVAAFGIGVGLIAVVKQVTELMKNITSPLQGLSDMLTGVGNAVTSLGVAAEDWAKAKKNNSIANVLKQVAIGLAVLAASVYFLSKIDTPKLWITIGAVAVLATILGALTIAITKLSGTINGVSIALKDVAKMSLAIIGVSLALVLMAKALKTLGSINSENVLQSLGLMTAIIVALGVFLVAVSKLGDLANVSGSAFKGVGKMMTKIATALLIMVLVIKLAGTIKEGAISKAIGVVTLFGGIAVAMAIVGRKCEYADKAGKMVKKLAWSLLIMVAVVKLSGLIKKSEVEKAVSIMLLFGTFAAVLIAVSHFAGENATKAGTMLLEITGALIIFIAAIKFIGMLKEDEILKGIAVIGAFTIFMSILIAVSKFAGKEAIKAGAMLMSVASAMVILSGVLFVLSKMDPDGLWNAVGAMTVIGIMLAVIVGMSHFASNSLKSLIAITVALGLLAGIIALLALMDTDKLWNTAGALSAAMLGFAAMLACMKNLKLEKGTITTLGVLILAIGLLGLVVAGLSYITNADTALQTAGALSILALAMAGCLSILNTIKVSSATSLLKTIGCLTALAVPLIAFALVLKTANGIENGLSNVLTLSALCAAMALLLIPLSLIASFPVSNIVIGVLALTGMALPLLAFVGILKLMSNVNKAATNVKALVTLATAMTLLLIPLTVIGAIMTTGIGAVAVVAGILALTAMAVPLMAFVGVLSLMSGIQNATQNCAVLTDMMTKLTAMLLAISLVAPLAILADVAIYGLIGAIVTIGVLATAVGAIMEKFPELESFLNKGLPVLEEVALSIGKILGNVVAGFTSSIADELPHLGTKLSEFMNNASDFINGAKQIDDSAVNGAKSLVTLLMELTGANLIEKMSTWLTNGESFARLGTELTTFITNAKGFIDELSNVDPNVMTGAKTLAEAIEILVKDNLLDTLTGWLNGDNDLANFGSKLGGLGTGLKEFVANIGTFSDEEVTTVDAASQAIKALAEAADEIPNTGGIIAAIVGDSDIGDFSGKFPEVGKGLKGFVDNIGTFSDDQVKTVEAGCNALMAIAKAAKEIPNTGGLVAAFVGDNDIGDFSGKFETVGKGLNSFITAIGTFDDNKLSTVEYACEALKSIVNIGWLVKDIGNDAGTKIKDVTYCFWDVGAGIANFVKSMEGVDVSRLNECTSKLVDFVDSIEVMANINADNMTNFRDALNEIADNGLKSFYDTITSEDNLSKVRDACKTFIDTFIQQCEDKKEDVKNKCIEVLASAIEGLENSDMVAKAKTAGENFTQGFANGISGNVNASNSAAYAVGQSAISKLQAAIDSHSPSKKSYKLGDYFGIGFVNGIRDNLSNVYTQSYSMGDQARIGLSKAISRVSEVIENGIDSQPTIRPVLDLSEVESGVGAIGSMLNSPSVGVLSNIGAISSTIGTKNQNDNSDVVSAINKLRNDLGNTGGDTYNVNGVTYDDGSEVSDAVKSLVRAARVERRK
jgi:hypothetical protein